MSYTQDSQSTTIPSCDVSRGQIHVNNAHIENTVMLNCKAPNSPGSAMVFNQSEVSVNNLQISFFKCDHCEFVSDSEQGLACHTEDQHLISCKLCLFSCLKSSILLQHMECEHDNAITGGELTSRINIMHKDGDPCLVCLSCDFLTHNLKRLVKHTKDEHPSRPPRSVGAIISKLRSARVRQDDATFDLVSLDQNVSVLENYIDCKSDFKVMNEIYDADVKPFDLNCPAINSSQAVPNARPNSTCPTNIMPIKSAPVEEILEELKAQTRIQPDSSDPIDIEPIKSVLVEEIMSEIGAVANIRPGSTGPIDIEPIKSVLVEEIMSEIGAVANIRPGSTGPIDIEPVKSVLLEEILDEIKAARQDCSTPLTANIESLSQKSLDHASFKMNEGVSNASVQIKKETVEYAQEAGELRQQIGKPASSSDCDTDKRSAGDSNVHFTPVAKSSQQILTTCQEKESNSQSETIADQRRVRIQRGATKSFYCHICDKGFMEKIHLTSHIEKSHPITEEPEDNLQISEPSSSDTSFVEDSLEEESSTEEETIADQRRVRIQRGATKSFYCHICDKGFMEKIHLTSHIQKSHPITEEPEDNLQISEPSSSDTSFVEDSLEEESSTEETIADQRRVRIQRGATKSFYCHICDKGFMEKIHLTSHIEKSHPITEEPEDNLQISEPSSSDTSFVEDSLEEESSTEEDTAESCPDELKSVHKLEQYMQSTHTGFLCTICDKTFTPRSRLKQHLMQCHFFEGKYARFLDKLNAAPDMHQDKLTTTQEEEKDPQSEDIAGSCPHCHKTVARLKHHIQSTHTGFVCTICFREYGRNSHLNRHIRTEHDAALIKDYRKVAKSSQQVLTTCQEKESNSQSKDTAGSCPHCHKFVARLKHHIQSTHTGFVCTICFREFKRKSHLKRHIRSVKHDAPHIKDSRKVHFTPVAKSSQQVLTTCQEKESNSQSEDTAESCPDNLKSVHRLEQYMQSTHTGFLCTICDKTFTPRSRLKQHLMQSHFFEGKYARFLDKLNVFPDMHQDKLTATQEEEKDPQSEDTAGSCPLCHKFVARLKHHIQSTHTGFVCTICFREFKRKSHLKTHTLHVHSEKKKEKPSVCEICGAVFAKARFLKCHMRKHDAPHIKDSRKDKKAHSLETDVSQERPCKKRKSPENVIVAHVKRAREDSKEFACKFCSYTSDKQDEMLDHIMETHCTLNQTEDESNEKHNQTASPGSPDKEDTTEKNAEVSCPYCFKEVNDLRNHIQNTHIGFMCCFCDGTFYKKSHLKKHTRFFHLNETKDDHIVCEFCGKDFETIKLLRTHFFQEHSGPVAIDSRKDIHPCQLCDCAFPTSLFLETHMKHVHAEAYKKAMREKSNEGKITGDGTETLREGDTNINMEASGNMANATENTEENPTLTDGSHQNLIQKESQLEATVQEKPFECNRCDKSFRNEKNYLIHLKTHKKGNRGKKSELVNTRMNAKKHPFKCTTCSKTFSCSSNLYKHMRIHTGEKKFKCSMCPKAYTDSSNLKRHEVSSHTDEKPYKCDECGKTFRFHGCLKLHMTWHTGERPFACDKCDKTFRTNNCLKDHTATHMAAMPFQCKDCEKGFRSKVALNRHSKNIHQKLCKFCGFQFANIKEHIKQSHKREKPYKCKICGYCVKDGHALRKHIGKHYK